MSRPLTPIRQAAGTRPRPALSSYLHHIPRNTFINSMCSVWFTRLSADRAQYISTIVNNDASDTFVAGAVCCSLAFWLFHFFGSGARVRSEERRVGREG